MKIPLLTQALKVFMKDFWYPAKKKVVDTEDPFRNISLREKERLLKYPAYISLLAANNDGTIDEAEKSTAVKLSHTKTFSCNPLLTQFYLEVDNVFENNIEQLNKSLPSVKDRRDLAIKKELLSLDKIVSKLGDEYAHVMHKSMKSFKEHVSKAHHNALVNFIFPLPITGITD